LIAFIHLKITFLYFERKDLSEINPDEQCDKAGEYCKQEDHDDQCKPFLESISNQGFWRP
jgi:hypothetical protein